VISRNSRYRFGTPYTSSDPVRAEQPISGLPARRATTDLTVRREHRVVLGDRLDLIAQRYYGDPLKFWLICDANDPMSPDELLVPGRVLRIPRNRT
jgi:nucleoid-associated protein YgaU